ncbi:MAG: hypothetical protein R6U63_14050 [Longimicrobiales bacterium]
MAMIPLLLAAALIPQSSLATYPLQPHGGPEVRVHRQATPLVALRLSTPVPVTLPEGAVELLQELARPDAEAEARRFGARVSLRHDLGRAVMTVTGPATAFDAMAAILRRAAGTPDLSVADLRRARARAEGRVLARLEQPAPRVRRYLHYGLHGGPEPRGAGGTRLGPEAIRRVGAELYRPGRVRVVLVGDVPDVVIRSAFGDWPTAREGNRAEPRFDTAAAAARPQADREWGGIAFPVEGDPAVLAVAAALVQQRVERSALRYGSVEAWYEPAPALVLVGAATPGDSVVEASAGISDLAVRDASAVPLTDVRRYLRRLIAEAAALAGTDVVTRARTAVRRRLLLEARTAAGKAEVIGRVADHCGPAVRADDYLERLEGVQLADVRALLRRLLETAAVVDES